jgi:hypothetical protein
MPRSTTSDGRVAICSGLIPCMTHGVLIEMVE